MKAKVADAHKSVADTRKPATARLHTITSGQNAGDAPMTELESIQKHYDQRTKRQRAYQRQQEIQEKL